MTGKKKCRVYCSVFGCNTYHSSDKSISFHWFPKEKECNVPWTNKNGKIEIIDKRRAWAINLKMNKATLKKSLRICSKHFNEDDYFASSPDIPKITRRLKRNVIPTKNLPKISTYNPSPKKRPAPKTRLSLTSCNHVKSFDFSLQQTIDVSNDEYGSLPSISDVSYLDNRDTNHSNLENVAQASNTVESRDFAVQVCTGDISVPFVSLLDTKAKLITMTGIPTFQVLDKIVELFCTKFPDIRTHQLGVRERIILVFIKLKQDISFAVLAVFFKNISLSTCRSIYISTIPLLGSIFENLIYWPSKFEIMSNIPYCFEKYKNVRVVLDCTEITVQKPKCLSCRIKLYSTYKSNFTIKYLIGISPAGLITFVSKPYGGRASDNVIFEQSNLISLMDRHDALMVDRGFKIDNICNEKGITLIRPPFLKGKNQFTREEALETKSIASARVHIERINQRIKVFKIFRNTFCWGHAHLAHDIMIIISGICNLGSPIFSADKFNTQFE